MKTTTTTKFFATMMAFVMMTSIGFAQQLREEQNWLQAWKGFAGSQYSALWLQGEIANGAVLYSDHAAGSLVLKTTLATDNLTEIESLLEEGIQAGNGNQMLASDATETLSHSVAVNTWQGQIGGRSLYAMVVAQVQNEGNSQLVIRLSLEPIHETVSVRNESALALLSQLGSDGLTSPLASHGHPTN